MNHKDKQDKPVDGKHDKDAPKPAGSQGAPAAENAVGVKETELQELRRAVTDYKDKYLRLAAECDNIRKRFEREKQEFVKYANEGLIVDFLNVLDDLERSVAAANVRHEDYASFLKGIEMIMARLYEMLKRNGLRAMETVGKKFDPHCHEVLMQAETDDRDEGMVVEEFQKGYFLGDRVVRTAKVKVAVKRRGEDADAQTGASSPGPEVDEPQDKSEEEKS